MGRRCSRLYHGRHVLRGQRRALHIVLRNCRVATTFSATLAYFHGYSYGVIIGYMAGALNNKSSNFKRMLGAGLTATVIVAIITTYLNYYVALTPSRAMSVLQWKDTSLGVAGIYAFVIDFIPSIALGVIIPVIAKVMTWYGLQPMRH